MCGSDTCARFYPGSKSSVFEKTRAHVHVALVLQQFNVSFQGFFFLSEMKRSWDSKVRTPGRFHNVLYQTCTHVETSEFLIIIFFVLFLLCMLFFFSNVSYFHFFSNLAGDERPAP